MPSCVRLSRDKLRMLKKVSFFLTIKMLKKYGTVLKVISLWAYLMTFFFLLTWKASFPLCSQEAILCPNILRIICQSREIGCGFQHSPDWMINNESYMLLEIFLFFLMPEYQNAVFQSPLSPNQKPSEWNYDCYSSAIILSMQNWNTESKSYIWILRFIFQCMPSKLVKFYYCWM